MASRSNKTKAIAFGGVLTGLAVVLMFMTGIFPFAEYSLPALAGVLLIAMVIEYGFRKALLCYVAVAVLSLFLVPNKEAAMLFAGFFGYYPILKGKIETLRKRPVEWVLKLVVFNISVLVSYLIIIYLFGVTEVLQEFGEFGKWSFLIFMIAGNAVFVLFDILLTHLIAFYIQYLKPKIFHKLNLH